MTETTVEDGRYLYCVVRIDGTGADGKGGENRGDGDCTSLPASTTGVADEPVRVVRRGDLAAVVHDCDSLYDSESMTEIQRWVLAHQSVVDDAGEAFGTPLPFQFDTILRGGDEGVRGWLAEQSATLSSHLDELAGRWEYRIEVVWDEDAAREEVVAGDDELQALRERRESAGEGTRFLLDKQYESRVKQLLSEHRRTEASSLADRLAPIVSEFRNLGQRSSAGLDVGNSEDVDVFARFAVLATDDQRDAVGDELDDVASDPGVEVRFTGPWPPYTFSPELGGGDATDQG